MRNPAAAAAQPEPSNWRQRVCAGCCQSLL